VNLAHPAAGPDTAPAADPPEASTDAAGSETAAGAPEELSGRQRAVQDVLAQAGQAGSAGERRVAEREARAGLATLSRADVTARTVYGGHHFDFGPARGAQLRSYRLTPAQVDEARHAFAPSARHPALLREAAGRPVVLLRGAAGTGRTAQAWSLLLAGGAAALAVVAPDTDLGRLSRDDLDGGTGYLVAGLDPEGVARLTDFVLSRLAAEVTARGCRLVILLSDADRPPAADPALRVLDIGPGADRAAVAAAHLRRLAGPRRAAEVRSLLLREDVRALLAAQLDPSVPLATAAELGTLLADPDLPRDGIASWVAERRRGARVPDVHDWFRGLPDLQTQALGVALAVFAGEPYETVSVLADSLKRRLDPPADEVKAERDRSTALSSTRRSRLAALGAELVPTQVVSRHGAAPGTVVRFRLPGRQRELLVHFWDEYDDHRVVMLDWLRQCARHELVSVRVRAAVAAGVLAGASFDLLRATVLDRWAGSDDELQREAAATALNEAVEDPRLRELVRRLVRSWASPGAGDAFHATAARSWRVLFGLPDSPAARLLHDLAATDDADVLLAIFRTVADQLATGEEQHRGEALALVRYWTHSRDPQRRPVGELAFLYAAVDLVEERAHPASGATERWPALLALAAADPLRMGDIADLWAAALCSADSWQAAQQCLTGWARTAEPSPAARQALALLLARAASTPRAARIVRHLAREWLRPDGPPIVPVATEVLSRLDERNRPA
jgi:hypothetical protein